LKGRRTEMAAPGTADMALYGTLPTDGRRRWRNAPE
jgi:hypothetical protein